MAGVHIGRERDTDDADAQEPTLSTRATVTTQVGPSNVSQVCSCMATHVISHTLHMREMSSSTLQGLPRITAIDDSRLQPHSSKALALSRIPYGLFP